MERLQAPAECLIYLQVHQSSHQRNSGPDVLWSQQVDPVRDLDKDLKPSPMIGCRVMPDQAQGRKSLRQLDKFQQGNTSYVSTSEPANL